MTVTTLDPARPHATPASASPSSGAWLPWSRRTWLATLHLLLDLPVGLLWGTLVVALVAAAAGLLPLALLGVPVLVVTLAGSLLAARAERARTRLLLGAVAPATTSLPRTRSGWLRLLVDARAWRSCGYAVVLMPLGVVNATVAATGWSLVLAGLTAQLWAWLLPTQAVTLGPWAVDGEAAVLLTTATAVLLGLAMPVVVRALSAVDGWLVRTLLR